MNVKHRRATNSFDGTDVCNSGRRLDVGHMLGIGDLLGLHVVDELVDETMDCFATSLQKSEYQSVEQRKETYTALQDVIVRNVIHVVNEVPLRFSATLEAHSREPCRQEAHLIIVSIEKHAI